MKSIYFMPLFLIFSLSASELKPYIVIKTLYGESEVETYLHKFPDFYIGVYNEEKKEFDITFHENKCVAKMSAYKVFLPGYYKDEEAEIGIFLARKKKYGPIGPALLRLLSQPQNPFEEQ